AAGQHEQMSFRVECNAGSSSCQSSAGGKREWLCHGRIVQFRRILRYQKRRIRRPLRKRKNTTPQNCESGPSFSHTFSSAWFAGSLLVRYILRTEKEEGCTWNP